MRAFFEWFKGERIDPNNPWLILGKGPSFVKRPAYDLGAFHTLSLNHAVREQPVRVAHILDYDVVDDCAEAIKNNAEVLVMPWRPHVHFVPGVHNLEELAQTNHTLQLLNEQGRLLWYNLSTTREEHGKSPVVRAEFFSAEAALNLLALAGVHEVRSLGVDGGLEYSDEFDDLRSKTLLSCGQESFDKQFKGFARTISTTGVDYAPLNVESPIRIYVGATEAQTLAVKVLAHSIRKHASMTVQVVPLHQAAIQIPQPKDEKNHPRTPFSFQRFLIPALNKHHGRAIYLDSDMLVFEDIRRIWNLPLDDVQLLTVNDRRSQKGTAGFSVMVLNCDALDWDIQRIVERLDAGSLSYEQLMFEMVLATKVRASINPAWNSLEDFKAGKTASLHYTNTERQPWLSRLNRWNRLWMETLFEAMDADEVALEEIEEHVRLGYVRPSLVYQAKWRIADSRKLPTKGRALDRSFVPQHVVGHWQVPTIRRRVANLWETILRHHSET